MLPLPALKEKFQKTTLCWLKEALLRLLNGTTYSNTLLYLGTHIFQSQKKRVR